MTVENSGLEDVDAFLSALRTFVASGIGELSQINWEMPEQETTVWQMNHPTPEQKLALARERWRHTNPAKEGQNRNKHP
jgi:hypothetical protein